MKLSEARHVLETLEVLSKDSDTKHHEAVSAARHYLKSEVASGQRRKKHCQDLNRQRREVRA